MIIGGGSVVTAIHAFRSTVLQGGRAWADRYDVGPERRRLPPLLTAAVARHSVQAHSAVRDLEQVFCGLEVAFRNFRDWCLSNGLVRMQWLAQSSEALSKTLGKASGHTVSPCRKVLVNAVCHLLQTEETATTYYLANQAPGIALRTLQQQMAVQGIVHDELLFRPVRAKGRQQPYLLSQLQNFTSQLELAIGAAFADRSIRGAWNGWGLEVERWLAHAMRSITHGDEEVQDLLERRRLFRLKVETRGGQVTRASNSRQHPHGSTVAVQSSLSEPATDSRKHPYASGPESAARWEHGRSLLLFVNKILRRGVLGTL